MAINQKMKMEQGKNIQTSGITAGQIALIVLAVITLGAILLWPKITAALANNDGSNDSGQQPSTKNPTLSEKEVKNAPAAESNSGKLIVREFVPAALVSERLQKKGQFGRWSDNEYQQNQKGYNDYWAKVIEYFGDSRNPIEKKKAGTINYREALASGFLKGMNMQQSVENLNYWRSAIQDYINASRNHLFHWEVATGQFLGKGGKTI